jgi:hypothetical protein
MISIDEAVQANPGESRKIYDWAGCGNPVPGRATRTPKWFQEHDFMGQLLLRSTGTLSVQGDHQAKRYYRSNQPLDQ